MAFQIADLYSTLSIRGASKLQGDLNNVSARLKRVSASMQGVARAARRGFLIMGAAVVGVLKLQADQQKAELMLDAALKATGQSVDALSEKLRKAAAEFQKATVYGDEFTLGLMAQAINLGAVGNEIEQYTRESIGLATALKMDLGTALRYTVLAHQNEFTMLRRYIPALRSTEDAVEQLAIIMRVANQGFEQAQEESKTFAGQLAQLKNRLGDLGETLGQALVPAITKMLKSISPFITQFRAWAIANQELAATFVGVSLGILAVVAVLPTLLTLLSAVAVHPAFAVLAVTVGLVLAKVIALKMELASLAAQIKAAPMGTAIEGKSREATEKALALLQQQRKAAVEALEALEAKELPEVVHGAMFGAVISHEALADIGDELAIARGEVEGFDDAIKKVVDTLRKMDEAATNSAKAIDKKARLLDIDIKETWWDVQEAEIDKLEAAAASYIDAARTPFENFQNTLEEINGLLAKNLLTQEQYAASAELARKAYEGTLPKVPTAAGSAFTGVEEMTRRIQEAAFQKDQEKETVLNTAAIKDNTKELKQFPFALETIAESWAVNTGMTMGP